VLVANYFLFFIRYWHLLFAVFDLVQDVLKTNQPNFHFLMSSHGNGNKYRNHNSPPNKKGRLYLEPKNEENCGYFII